MFLVHVYLFFIALISVFTTHVAAEQYKIVETLDGQVRGVQKLTLLKEIPFYSFKGIPYAKPPIGDLRFKVPEPVESWNHVLDAFEHGKICVQPGKLVPQPFAQSEDCLTLNIFVPANIKTDEKLAVLLFIHGGGYAEGSSNDYFHGPDFIIEKQTIVVTINYRLGLLGFLSLDSPEISGNMGLKDQQLALKWIHSNIGRFGGDNKRITVFGESAGGASVHLHVLSAESRKYFRNAIIMSGVVDNYWAMSDNNDHVELAYQMARELDEPKDTIEELVAFLKSAPPNKLSQNINIAETKLRLPLPFTPVIERKDAIQPFIVDTPKHIYETKKVEVDVLFTMTSAEMVGFLSMLPPLKDQPEKFDIQLPFRGLRFSSNSEEHRNLTAEIHKFYFGDGAKEDRSINQYAELLSDLNFRYGIDKAVKTHAAKSKGKTYYSWFSVDSKLNAFKSQNPDSAKLPGASHAEDLFYLFRCHMVQSLYDEVISSKDDEHSKISLQAIDHISKIFTNFAKYGKPTHQNDPLGGFQPVNNDEVHYLDITNGGLTTGVGPNQKAFELWASIEQRAMQLSEGTIKPLRDEL
ncbi:juvenile hormone esterase-like [Sitodiplosis mosellana]|uniref:juvenile hormone esterase-like n=1 Tax=Sitodiplosis mosellana TaxID=263140 RepID=UPI002443D155|nr:juvenile hormone esterase-like [Sitodiplosis mosellana]